ncbi:hypothetical protein B0H10DRAFT_2120323 [Mycena sp. CBHHK59/15]|nr:hypothetical protein B0H10DRAFT_2120323 [Mycena sp. CBHHK59/15]
MSFYFAAFTPFSILSFSFIWCSFLFFLSHLLPCEHLETQCVLFAGQYGGREALRIGPLGMEIWHAIGRRLQPTCILGNG